MLMSFTPATQAELIFSDDFNDDSGVLTSENATTGQIWDDITDRTSLDAGTQFGQSSVGAGNENSELTWLWLVNQISFGQIVDNGTVVLAADLTKDHLSSDGRLKLISI